MISVLKQRHVGAVGVRRLVTLVQPQLHGSRKASDLLSGDRSGRESVNTDGADECFRAHWMDVDHVSLGITQSDPLGPPVSPNRLATHDAKADRRQGLDSPLLSAIVGVEDEVEVLVGASLFSEQGIHSPSPRQPCSNASLVKSTEDFRNELGRHVDEPALQPLGQP